ncbi:hypothetical protein V5O48_013958 [Marasmius crinis-equi]|uniref:G-alpha-domain-containing protein n=1 Tax=Marasmius crinis-equi TaxID=585013 RepID=A0ABR3EYM8_9AGAR
MPGALRQFASDGDPFAEFMKPPKGESESEKAARLLREAEEQKVSNAIDEEISMARAVMKKEKYSVVKILLLGQSESGKSTALKNFRMAYDQAQWLREKASWRAVVQLNIIRSIGSILDALQSESNNEVITLRDAGSRYLTEDDVIDTPVRRPSPKSNTSTSEFLASPRSPTRKDYEIEQKIPLSDTHENLRRRLAPLNSVEADLKRVLGVGTEEVRSMDQEGGDVRDNVALPSESPSRPPSPRKREEIFVRPWLWKEALQTGLHGSASTQNGERIAGLNADSRFEEAGLQQASRVIANCKDAMKSLWTDETVRKVLVKRNVRIEESAGFFLEDLDRIATPGYDPSDDDVVRCRLRTVGVQEYRLTFDSKALRGAPDLECIIYDVGGSRTVRRAWIPYFENIDAILFPLSAFDETLLEDATVNRLQDTISIWRAVCASKLLVSTTLVCFMNKCDLLRKKLKSGTKFRDYVPAYGDDTANDTASVVRYMKDRFKEIVIKTAQDPTRLVYLYPTSCTDTKATGETLKTVRDSILRHHLKSAGLF